MTEPETPPIERLHRMRETFSEDLSVLVEDYEHFAGGISRDGSIRRNTGSDRSAERNERPVPEPN